MKAIVLLSGGLDSSTTLYYAKSKGYDCRALIFDYGQRHRRELKSAVAIAKLAKVDHQIIRIKLPWGGSDLLGTKVESRNSKLEIRPKSKFENRSQANIESRLTNIEYRNNLPPTYVP
ncbi:7-cyano-7-deazaguanine synthase, partial [Patescibacteria group bacterium]|nr:7-cyano-7-deazaguanine synthase [Patescibacteria group bacterium]